MQQAQKSFLWFWPFLLGREKGVCGKAYAQMSGRSGQRSSMFASGGPPFPVGLALWFCLCLPRVSVFPFSVREFEAEARVELLALAALGLRDLADQHLPHIFDFVVRMQLSDSLLAEFILLEQDH